MPATRVRPKAPRVFCCPPTPPPQTRKLAKTDQTTAAHPGPGLAGPARKGPSPTPRDLAARAASRDTAESHPGPAGSGPAPQGAPAPGERPRSDPGPRHDPAHRAPPRRSDPAAAAGTRMTGAPALVRAREQLGVDVVFGIPGGAILPLYDPLFDSPSVRHILVRHEQGAGHAATGYAQVTGRPGVCMATSGPGATNLVTPLSDAYMDSVPVVAITGQVSSNLIGTDGFQEADISGITLPVTKHNF